MTTLDAPTAPSPSPSAPAVGSDSARYPMVVTALSRDEIRDKLDYAARRGRMPGLSLDTSRGVFEIKDFGQPFESVLVAELAKNGAEQVLRFTTRLRPVLPIVFAVMLIISIWPGIYLVDSMLDHYFSWYNIPTWWWYLPLTVPTSPFLFRSVMRNSRASAEVDARTLIQKVAAELNATTVDAPAASPTA